MSLGQCTTSAQRGNAYFDFFKITVNAMATTMTTPQVTPMIMLPVVESSRVDDSLELTLTTVSQMLP